MDTAQVQRLGDDLAEYVGDVFASLRYAGWQDRAGHYLRGLMLDGRRKSIQPMAARLHGPHEQALNHFVTNSPWDVTPVRRRIAERMSEAMDSVAWAIDDTGLLKYGKASPCVARQYTGTAGKITNCQVAVSVSLVTETASCPVDWRLFVPESWDPASPKAATDAVERRRRAQIPDTIGYTPKWRLALAMVDELLGWGLRPRVLVADAGYGDAGQFRQALAERGIDYAVQVAHTVTAYPLDVQRTTVPYRGDGPYPKQIYRQPAPTIRDLLATAGPKAARPVTWRDSSRHRNGRPVPMSSKFVFQRVRPAGPAIRSANLGHDLPEAWLIAEWPAGEPEPVKYWLSNLPATTAKRTLIRLAKLRWRIEHDYREVKTGLGLDHYEGRTWQGWHHHTTLVSAAHAFLTLQRLDPKTRAPE
uniref:IS701 family transposase n=1 Tax=Paractinoplanes polyasparticus TaxID=2856853 RepID=UPI001C865EA6|nr:IS701 family transposase [Actinoplanes polyasparticus]